MTNDTDPKTPTDAEVFYGTGEDSDIKAPLEGVFDMLETQARTSGNKAEAAGIAEQGRALVGEISDHGFTANQAKELAGLISDHALYPRDAERHAKDMDEALEELLTEHGGDVKALEESIRHSVNAVNAIAAKVPGVLDFLRDSGLQNRASFIRMMAAAGRRKAGGGKKG